MNESITYYHTTATAWDGGDLQCWSLREAAGLVTADEWKWELAPVGTDGHLVSLATSLDEIRNVRYCADVDMTAGEVLAITIPADMLTDDEYLDWDDEDERRVCLTEITDEGDPIVAAIARIPAAYITKVA